MIINQNNTLILIVDIQEKLLNAVFNKNRLQKNAEIITKTAEILKIPVVITEQYPKGLGSTLSKLAVNAQIFTKNSFNALAEKPISESILGKKEIIILGIETHICIYQTVCALINEGYKVTVVKDACGSRFEEEYHSALDCMKNIGAQIKTTEMIIFELLKTSNHPNFKEIQALIK